MKGKRLLALLLVFVLALMCGCTAASSSAGAAGGETAEPDETTLDPANPVTLTLWHYYVGENQQALESAVAAFNQTVGIERGVIVDPVAKGKISELEEAVTNSAMGVINAAPMPDIFSSYPDKAMEIDALDMVCDLNAYFTEEEKQQYVQGFIDDGIFDGGRFLLVPIVKSTELTYVNDTAWQAFAQSEGYSQTDLASWEGVYETAKAYYEWTDAQTPDEAWDGRGLMGFDSVANFVIVGSKQMGVDIIDAQADRAVLDREVLRRIFDIYYKGMSLGYLDAVDSYRSDDIKRENIIAYVGSSSSAAYFPTWIERDNTQMPIDFLPLQYPTFQGGTAYAIQQGAGMCVANTTQQKQEGAVLFLKWFTNAEQNITFAMTTGYLPVQAAAYESPEFDAVLEELRGGDAAQQNVAGVYEIALHQITEASTYAAKPFDGSYEVRTTLQSTLMDAGDAGEAAAAPLKEQGLTEEEILQQLDVDARFEEWIASIKTALDGKQIAYVD